MFLVVRGRQDGCSKILPTLDLRVRCATKRVLAFGICLMTTETHHIELEHRYISQTLAGCAIVCCSEEGNKLCLLSE